MGPLDQGLWRRRDLVLNGTSAWANGGHGVKIGSGWQNFCQVVDGQ